jgi:hypothetical protein
MLLTDPSQSYLDSLPLYFHIFAADTIVSITKYLGQKSVFLKQKLGRTWGEKSRLQGPEGARRGSAGLGGARHLLGYHSTAFGGARRGSARLSRTRRDSTGLGGTRRDSTGLGGTQRDSAGLGGTRRDSAGLGGTRRDSAGTVSLRLAHVSLYRFSSALGFSPLSWRRRGLEITGGDCLSRSGWGTLTPEPQQGAEPCTQGPCSSLQLQRHPRLGW